MPPIGLRIAFTCATSLLFLAAAGTSVASAAPAVPARLSPAPEPLRGGFGKGPTAQFDLVAPGGYQVEVTAFGPVVSVDVSKGKASSDYFTVGAVHTSGLEAHFADLGEISVRFRATGKVTRIKPQPGCKAPNLFTYRHGVFSGTIRFSGENGYLALDAQKAKGTITTPSTFDCPPPKGHGNHAHKHHHRPQPKSHVLSAELEQQPQTGKIGNFSIATVPAPNAEDVVFALATEKHESVNIQHWAIGFFPPSSFIFDNALSTAQVSLPAPFSGTGEFQRNADGSTSWTGSLSASFPGVEGVPFTGPDWKARLGLERSEGAGGIVVVQQ